MTDLQRVTEGSVCTTQGTHRFARHVALSRACTHILTGVLKQCGDVGVALAYVSSVFFPETESLIHVTFQDSGHCDTHLLYTGLSMAS